MPWDAQAGLDVHVKPDTSREAWPSGPGSQDGVLSPDAEVGDKELYRSLRHAHGPAWRLR